MPLPASKVQVGPPRERLPGGQAVESANTLVTSLLPGVLDNKKTQEMRNLAKTLLDQRQKKPKNKFNNKKTPKAAAAQVESESESESEDEGRGLPEDNLLDFVNNLTAGKPDSVIPVMQQARLLGERERSLSNNGRANSNNGALDMLAARSLSPALPSINNRSQSPALPAINRSMSPGPGSLTNMIRSSSNNGAIGSVGLVGGLGSRSNSQNGSLLASPSGLSGPSSSSRLVSNGPLTSLSSGPLSTSGRLSSSGGSGPLAPLSSTAHRISSSGYSGHGAQGSPKGSAQGSRLPAASLDLSPSAARAAARKL